MKKYLRICAALCVVLLCCSFIAGCGNGTGKETETSTKLELPWENGGKQPSEYTWEEFEALDGTLRVAFQQSFGSMDNFNKWMKAAKGVNTQDPEPENDDDYQLELPWENGGKQPGEYTWEEFLALDGGMQIAFQQSFGSYEAFEQWQQSVNDTQTQVTEPEQELPWENGGKQPQEYTWEDFEALNGDQQIEFQRSFGSIEAFEEWRQRVNGGSTEATESETGMYLPWENGGKQPADYTWDEFLALDGAQQIAFQNSFDSMDEFDVWLQRVHPQ